MGRPKQGHRRRARRQRQCEAASEQKARGGPSSSAAVDKDRKKGTVCSVQKLFGTGPKSERLQRTSICSNEEREVSYWQKKAHYTTYYILHDLVGLADSRGSSSRTSTTPSVANGNF